MSAVLFLKIIWLLCSASFAADKPAAAAQNAHKFPVKEVRGHVLAWEPWASQWIPVVQGSFLWESTLIQVPSGASVTVQMKASAGFQGLQSDTVDISLNKPAVFRLDTGLLRKVTLNTFFIPQLPEITQAKGEGVKDLLYDKFGEAWDRFAAVVMPGRVKASFLKDLNSDEQDTSISTKAKRIRLYSPTDDMLLVADKLPVEFTVLWKSVPEPNASYEVMIWRIDEKRRPPLAVTRFDYHYARIFHEGDYYVQVGSTDGRYLSTVRQVHVVLPVQNFSSKAISQRKGDEPLPLLLPPEGFDYLPRQLPTEVTFNWDQGTVGSNVLYQFMLKDANGRDMVRRQLQERTMRLKINRSGEYKWQVQAIPQQVGPRAPSASKIFSEVRTFRIQTAAETTGKPLTTLFDELLNSGHSGVIYAEGEFK